MSTLFEWQTLLLRINGNQELGRRLLAAFLAEHVSPAAALADIDPAGARLLLHRMAGSAANLGLESLAQACRQGEALVAGGSFPGSEYWRRVVAEIEESLRATRSEITDFLAQSTTEAPAPSTDHRDAAVLATDLAAMLAENDLTALALAERWAQAAGGESAAAVLERVHALDFPAAIQMLQQQNPHHD